MMTFIHLSMDFILIPLFGVLMPGSSGHYIAEPIFFFFFKEVLLCKYKYELNCMCDGVVQAVK